MTIHAPHLPTPPSGFEYKKPRPNAFPGCSAYLTTGWFHPETPDLKKNSCEGVGTLFLDFDLCDWLGGDTRETKKLLHASGDAELEDLLESHLQDVRKHLLEVFEADPTALVCSGYGFHAYYWLDRPDYELREVQTINKKAVKKINALARSPLADENATNVGERLSRPPGTENDKGLEPREVRLVHVDPTQTFSLSAIEARLRSRVSGLQGLKDVSVPVSKDFSRYRLHSGEILETVCRGLRQGEKLRIKCPFHEGKSLESAFLRLDSDGVPFVRCESEKVTYRPKVWAPSPGKTAKDLLSELSTTKKGEVKKTLLNIQKILKGDERVSGVWWDERLREVHVVAAKGGAFEKSGAVTDVAILRLKEWLATNYGFEASKELLVEAVTIEADQNKRNPLVEWLEKVEAEADPYDDAILETWLSESLGVPLTALSRAYARKFLVSAVARARAPGCRVDTVLTLVGAQGIGKSSAFQLLAPDGYFSDTHLDVSSKDSFAQLSRAWIYEISELSSFSKREHEAVKAWISSREDSYRPPYGRFVERHPRQTVLVATTNDATPLTDATGSRRFWTVQIDPEKGLDRDWLGMNRRKIWGAAARAHSAGVAWWLTEREEDLRRLASEDFTPEDPLDSQLESAYRHLPDVFTMTEVFDVLSIPTTNRNRLQKAVTNALKRSGAQQLTRRRNASGARVSQWKAPGRDSQQIDLSRIN